MPRGGVGPNGLKTSILRFPARGGLVDQTIQGKKIAHTQEEIGLPPPPYAPSPSLPRGSVVNFFFVQWILGRLDVPPKSAPSTRKFCFSIFGPGISLSAKACPSKNGLKLFISRFPARGGPVGQTVKCKKNAHFWREIFGAAGFPPQKCP